MGLIQVIKAAGTALTRPRFLTNRGRYWELQLPPALSNDDYLRLYGQVGWLFGCVSVIAQATAEPTWHLYRTKQDGTRQELFDHPVLTLIKLVNPFQTRYQFMALGQTYISLAGEAFIILNSNTSGIPVEMVLAPPNRMSIKPGAGDEEYISGYTYNAGGVQIPLSPDEVIHILTPNPLNPFRGLAPVKAIAYDLDAERQAARYQQKLFYNDARPGGILASEQPPPPKQTRDELRDEWKQEHQGTANAYKTAFLWGGLKFQTVSMTNRDLDFEKLRKCNRDTIIGAYHVPRSMLGITEDVNRANAESAEYTFAKYVVRPALVLWREAFNEQLLPRFGADLELDFDDPVPGNREADRLEASDALAKGAITINEYRDVLGWGPINGGDVRLEPYTVVATPVAKTAPTFTVTHDAGCQCGKPHAPAQLNRGRPLLQTEDQITAYWKVYTARAAAYETKLTTALRTMFNLQEYEALAQLQNHQEVAFNLVTAQADYKAAVAPTLTALMTDAVAAATALLATTKGPPPATISPAEAAARAWLETRIGWAAAEVGEETAALLARTLGAGYAAGESIDQLAERVKATFDYCSDVRAERIARTEAITASSEGAMETYRASGVVHKVKWWTAPDERTCETCLALHETEYALDDGPRPALHPNCRCVILPIVE